MFHKIMLHSVPPSNFRDNSSTLVISSPFKLAPFFLRIWYKIVLCERICKMINVWIYLVELWLRNVVTFLWISVSTEKATYQCYQLNLMNICKIFEKNCPISTFCNFSYEILHFSKTQSWQHWYATNCWKTQFYKNFFDFPAQWTNQCLPVGNKSIKNNSHLKIPQRFTKIEFDWQTKSCMSMTNGEIKIFPSFFSPFAKVVEFWSWP